MTRSRAKATDNTIAPKPTKITTAAAKAAAKPTKRKTRADEDEDEVPDVQEGGDELATDMQVDEPMVTRKPTANAALKAPSATASTVSTTNKTGRATATRGGRGRPTKASSTRTTTKEDVTAGQAPVTRNTRARAASVTEAATESEQPGLAKRPALKKKVTFAEGDSDKENAVQVTAKKQDATTNTDKQTGMKAKPVRGAATRGRGGARGGRAQRNAPRPAPLSPKKNVQVGVVKQDEDDDMPEELQTTPEKQLHKSPIKPPQSGTSKTSSHDQGSETLLEQDQQLGVSVDELQGSAALFCSPAKKLGPSIPESPTKAPDSPTKSVLQQSPRKFAPISSEVPSTDARQARMETVMAQPAKKFPMSAPHKQPVFDMSKQAQNQSSMFSSPAKRPASPIKGLRFGSNVKGASSGSESFSKSLTASGVSGTPRKLFSPMKASSAFRAAKSPVAAFKVHKMTDEEQTQMLNDELRSAPSPLSPMNANATLESPPQKSRIPVRSPPRPDVTQTQSDSEAIASASKMSPVLPVTEHGQSTPFRSYRDSFDDFSDDELSYDVSTHCESPLYQTRAASNFPRSQTATPKFVANGRQNDGPMTALAKRFGDWQGASPDAETIEQRQAEKSMFSQIAASAARSPTPQSPTSAHQPSPAPGTSFEDAIAIHEDADEDETMQDLDDGYEEESVFRQSQMSEASQEYGDENAIPIDPATYQQIVAEDAALQTCTPARTMKSPQRMAYTVSKVPLKPAADDDTPRQKPMRRGHSLAAALSPQAELELNMLRQCHPLPSYSTEQPVLSSLGQQARTSKFAELLDEEDVEQVSTPTPAPSTPGAKTISTAAATPAKTPRAGLNTKLLAGAVVFVDVHTSEGADASGIFVELLTQMGGRCVKQWNWSSRGSLDGSHTAGDLEEAGSPKVGITHVVFKDGGKRTMEKVREAKGLVMCVGVGWVLE